MSIGAPGGARESGGGDAAAAFVFGGDDEAIARVRRPRLGHRARSSTPGALPEMAFPRQWEERFGAEVMLPDPGRHAEARARVGAGLKPDQISKVILDSTNPRVNREFLGIAKVKPEQLADRLRGDASAAPAPRTRR